MSTVKTTNFQVGTSGTASQNFTITAPSDGTFKISRGNAGATTGDLLTIDASNNISINAISKLGNVQIGTSITSSQNFSLLAPTDGTFKLSRGNLGATTGDSLTVDASNNITINAAALNIISTNFGVNSTILSASFTNFITNTTAVFVNTENFTVNSAMTVSTTLSVNTTNFTVNSATVFNDVVVSRAMTRDMGAVYVDKGTQTTGTITFDYTGGSLQRLQVGGALTIAFSNFPPTGNMGVIQIELVNGGSATVTFPTINWVKKDGTFTTSITTYLSDFGRAALQTSGTDFFVVWTRDAGTTLYGKLL